MGIHRAEAVAAAHPRCDKRDLLKLLAKEGCAGQRGLCWPKRAVLAKDGWVLKNTEGSHRQFIHRMKPGEATVNGHPSGDVPAGTLKSIPKQASLK